MKLRWLFPMIILLKDLRDVAQRWERNMQWHDCTNSTTPTQELRLTTIPINPMMVTMEERESRAGAFESFQAKHCWSLLIRSTQIWRKLEKRNHGRSEAQSETEIDQSGLFKRQLNRWIEYRLVCSSHLADVYKIQLSRGAYCQILLVKRSISVSFHACIQSSIL